MKTELILTKRNIRLFFKDAGMFFTSLITPLILLVLYATFLSNVYRDSFSAQVQGFPIDESLINSLTEWIFPPSVPKESMQGIPASVIYAASEPLTQNLGERIGREHFS